jgi:DNA invertase Pin-like site-specific DNA recombinase
VKGYSLDVQERNCLEWCKSNGVAVDSVFVDAGESAQTTKRTHFKEMLKYAKENRTPVQIVLVDKIDRFSRSLKDGATLHFTLEEWGIKLRSVKEHIDETPFGKANVGSMFVWAQLDNDMRRKSTTEGMVEALHAGRWTFKTPLGYMPGSKGKLVHDHVCAPIIAAMF